MSTVAQAVLPCLQQLWGCPQLPELSPKVVELLIGTIRHLYSSEKLIATKLEEFLAGEEPPKQAPPSSASTSSSTSTPPPPLPPAGGGANIEPPPPASSSSSAAAAAAAAAAVVVIGGGGGGPPRPPPVPRVDPLYLQQLCDMGFSRPHAEEALLACGNDLSTAMEWILSHPPSSSSTSEVSSGKRENRLYI